MPTKYDLIDLVRRKREAAGLSMAEAARISQVNTGTISLFETGKRLPAPASFTKYINACKITGPDRSMAMRWYNILRRGGW